MSQRTPGPWTFKLKNAGNGFIVSDDESMICDVFMTNDSSVAKERARLIAAAPELSEICRFLHQIAQARSNDQAWKDTADMLANVLAKVEAR